MQSSGTVSAKRSNACRSYTALGEEAVLKKCSKNMKHSCFRVEMTAVQIQNYNAGIRTGQEPRPHRVFSQSLGQDAIHFCHMRT